MKHAGITGWNTWNTESVLSHVLMPQGLEVSVAIKDFATSEVLENALMGRIVPPGSPQRQDCSYEVIRPVAHSFDGAYTHLILSWRGIELDIETASSGSDWVMSITPISIPHKVPNLIFSAAVLWNRVGYVEKDGRNLRYVVPGEMYQLSVDGFPVDDPAVYLRTPYLCAAADRKTVLRISPTETGSFNTSEETVSLLRRERIAYHEQSEAFGANAELFDLIRQCQAWNRIYDPIRDTAIFTVSRIWNSHWLGWVQHCWDTFFSAYLATLGDRETSYANVRTMLNNATPDGFVPNCAAASGFRTLDRSQPPVGSFCVREIYRKWRDLSFVDEVLEGLYLWNTWYFENRRIQKNLMGWGSTPYEAPLGNYWESAGVGKFYGAAMESGMDNSHMYDDVPLNHETHVMDLADVGLMSLFIWDCENLTDLARLLGRQDVIDELRQRSRVISCGLDELWDEDYGLFLNKCISTGESSRRISPTNMYPLLTGQISQDRADRIVSDHLLNEEEFWGTWVVPSTPRNDPSFPEQDYWRGRIWPPLNFLVYLGLRQHGFKNAAAELAAKSRDLVLKEWRESGHLHENYNADSGEGCDVVNSDPFLNWGCMLALIPLIEDGQFPAPDEPPEEL